jgi:hypothetical protein
MSPGDPTDHGPRRIKQISLSERTPDSGLRCGKHSQ